MGKFIHDSFLLKTATARRLYHDFAAGLPIIDYDNHLDPRMLADNCQFENVAQLWLGSDPYENRAMRIAGVPGRSGLGQVRCGPVVQPEDGCLPGISHAGKACVA